MTNARVASPRVPQEERTRAMRQRLLEATVECLVEHGWSGTSTTLVSQRAGVSRGAQLHHFPTKTDLVVAAVEHLSEVRGEELREAASRLPSRQAPHPRCTGDVRRPLHLAGVHGSSRALGRRAHRRAAARRRRTPRAARRPRGRSHRGGRAGVDESQPRVREMVQATLDLVRGLGLANTITDDTARRRRILNAWARTLDAELRPA